MEGIAPTAGLAAARQSVIPQMLRMKWSRNTGNNTGDKFRSRPSPLGARDEEDVRFDSTSLEVLRQPLPYATGKYVDEVRVSGKSLQDRRQRREGGGGEIEG